MKTLSFLVVLGCLNSPTMEKSLNGWTSDGHRLFSDLSRSMRRSAEDKQRRLSDRSNPQDAAVAAILGGDYVAGIAMLQKLETQTPGDYHTAANLGTAFELAGDNEKALKWIQEALKRNPLSHQGTEWLHVLILEGKVNAAKGGPAPVAARLVPLPESVGENELIRIQQVEHSAKDVFKALAYQLNERMVFVKPKDRWVAECLYSLAILQAHFYSVEDALRILGLAEQYGFPDNSLLQSRRRSFERSILWGEIQFWGGSVVGGVAGIAAILFGWRKLSEMLSP